MGAAWSTMPLSTSFTTAWAIMRVKMLCRTIKASTARTDPLWRDRSIHTSDRRAAVVVVAARSRIDSSRVMSPR